MTTLSTRLAALHQQRGVAVASYEATLQPSLTENRDLNETEQTAIDALQEQIEGFDKQIDRLTQAEALLARNTAPVLHAVPGDRPGTYVTLTTPRDRPQVQMARRDAYKGADFTRMAIAICIAGQWNAAEYARQRWGDDELCEVIRTALWLQRAPVVPPMGSGDAPPPVLPAGSSGAASLVRLEHMGSEFIELLRPLLIVTRLPNKRQLQFNNAGTLLIPRQAGGVAGGYVGEGNSIRVERLTFDQMRLVPSKLAVIVPTTTELLQRSDPGVEQLVRDDMTAGTARTIDQIFFSTLAASTQGANPAGILFGRPQNVGGNLTEDDDPANNPVTAVTASLKAMIMALRMADVPMTAPVWIMHARTKEYLRLLRTTQEIFAFKAEIDAGTLLGFPIVDSTSIPIPFPPGTGQATGYALIDASQVIWAEDMLPMIDGSEHASIISDAQPPSPPIGPLTGFMTLSAFQNDLFLMRIRMRHTWARRHDVAVTWALATPA